jgi:hypothetical protein
MLKSVNFLVMLVDLVSLQRAARLRKLETLNANPKIKVRERARIFFAPI